MHETRSGTAPGLASMIKGKLIVAKIFQSSRPFKRGG
jgi:hypothetical protein